MEYQHSNYSATLVCKANRIVVWQDSVFKCRKSWSTLRNICSRYPLVHLGFREHIRKDVDSTLSYIDHLSTVLSCWVNLLYS